MAATASAASTPILVLRLLAICLLQEVIVFAANPKETEDTEWASWIRRAADRRDGETRSAYRAGRIGHIARGSPSAYHARNQMETEAAKAMDELGLEQEKKQEDRRRKGSRAHNFGLRQLQPKAARAGECHQRPRCRRTQRYRTMDGSCNNLNRPVMGKSNTPLLRLLPSRYSDGVSALRQSARGGRLPPPRVVSLRTRRNRNVPARERSESLFIFGQFLAHDVTLVPFEGISCCDDDGGSPGQSPKCQPIIIPRNDPHWRGRRCFNFVRSDTSLNIDCKPGTRQQLNRLTHWLDASNVYGSTEEESDRVRSKRWGQLRTGNSPSRGGGHGRGTMPTDNSEAGAEAPCRGTSSCYMAGDVRNSEQPTLAAMHILWMREHNRIARKVAHTHPDWDDERMFQETRKLVVAEYQHVVYNEWLPALIGAKFMRDSGMAAKRGREFRRGYDATMDPRISNVFATAALRVGHSIVTTKIYMRPDKNNGRGQYRSIPLRTIFNNVDLTKSGENIDSFFRGFFRKSCQEADDNFAPDVTEHLFETEDGNGMDLVSLNIQRGRDHGLPPYVEFKQYCSRGRRKRRARRFSDLRRDFSSKNLRRLRSVYRNVRDIDVYVGMFLEEKEDNEESGGSFVGPTFQCLIAEQFRRLQSADRFFYDFGGHVGSLTPTQLREIRKTSLARIICDNSDAISEVQRRIFEAKSKGNPRTMCRKLRKPNWRKIVESIGR